MDQWLGYWTTHGNELELVTELHSDTWIEGLLEEIICFCATCEYSSMVYVAPQDGY